eukprot:TRINITY_DN9310_c0_g1_i1.p1 TRINITY_DN9310_c0_g1~~TRINITY_DN9310_c0_g1_i1.p1  ORF type:complete len:375 (+),score=76.10 TRINITY_DN9310_c0_g1_i1:55-1179(+)
MSKGAEETITPDKKEYCFVDWCEVGHYDVKAGDDPKERMKIVKQHSRPLVGKKAPSVQEMRQIAPMTFLEEAFCVLVFLFTFPGCYVYVPVGLVFAIWYLRNHLLLAGFVVVLAYLGSKTPLKHLNPPTCVQYRKFWLLMFKYFSFKGVVPTEPMDPNRSYIFVAPPHGVIPLGNLLAVQSIYVANGFTLHGMVASVVLKIPMLRNFVNWWGAIDASKEIAAKALLDGESLGLSTGGIAELFETGKEDEIIWLNRTGYVRLAFETGASIQPSYLMGNTKLFDCIVDDAGVLQRISRKLQISVTAFWGRWLLPIPRRVPIWGLMGNPIHLPKKANPTAEEIKAVHMLCVAEIQRIFDEHKEAYGWGHRKLIIKTE